MVLALTLAGWKLGIIVAVCLLGGGMIGAVVAALAWAARDNREQLADAERPVDCEALLPGADASPVSPELCIADRMGGCVRSGAGILPAARRPHRCPKCNVFEFMPPSKRGPSCPNCDAEMIEIQRPQESPDAR
jgi:hypothetical protein